MSSVAPFIAPVLTAVAAFLMPPIAPLVEVLGEAAAAGLVGAGLGAGGSLLGSAITGQYVNPLNVAIGAGTGGLGGFAGAGGFGGLADALGLGSSAASGAAAGGIAETAGAAATEAAAQSAAPVAAASPVGAGGTAAAMAGTVDPVYGSSVVGGQPALGASSSLPTGAYFASAPAAGSSAGGIASKGLDVLSKIGQTVGLGQMASSILGGGQQQGGMGRGFGGQYTTGQGGQYTPYNLEGGLGTAPTPGFLDPAGRFVSSKQRQGSLGDYATSVLG